MLRVRIDDTLEMHCELDDYTDPWTSPETILLVHGVADTSKAWFAWVPRLARRFRVLRPDLRGFGRSSVPPPDYAWSVAGLARDLKTLLDRLEIASVHVVGQRVGGSVAMQFAHDYPAATRSLVVIGGPATLAKSALDPGAWLDQVRREGVEAWARATMGARLGDASPAMREWWIGEMGKAPRPVMEGIFRARLCGNGARLAAPHPGLQAAGSAEHRLSPRRDAPRRVRRGDDAVHRVAAVGVAS
jgi:pimeloyl-ACP methyl ester carboxylesterase